MTLGNFLTKFKENNSDEKEKTNLEESTFSCKGSVRAIFMSNMCPMLDHCPSHN